MVSDLIDILKNRVNLKNHPFFKDLSQEALVGYRKACIDIAMELEHAINYDEITFQIKVDNIKKKLNIAIKEEHRKGRPSTFGIEE